MIRVLAVSACLAAFGGCKQGGHAPPPVTYTMGSDGLRHVAIRVDADGYTPARIPGKPGEHLVLSFTRTIDSTCVSQLKAPDGKLVDLPLGHAVDVTIAVPPRGEVGFACGMDMFHGAIVAQPQTPPADVSRSGS
jgi:plastocyanin domain-containing protein